MQDESAVSERQALEAFLLDNPELERLENLLEEFNLFEAIGAVRQELRHSDFLAFLLDPNQNHGLGDLLAKRLLQQALSKTPEAVTPEQVTSQDRPSGLLTPLDIALLDLDDLEVRREWRHIDILLLDEAYRLAVIVENKVGSDEHSEQLPRYWQSVRRAYPDYRILGLYLTPEGRSPTDARYLPVDYDLIHELVSDLVETRASVLGPDVRTALSHYAQMLRRHIMPDSEIAELCRRIYRKHKRALDLIYEHRPDLQEEIRNLLEQYVIETPGLKLDHCTKTRVRFLSEEWDSPALTVGEGWTPSGRMLLGQFMNARQRLYLRFLIGPGPDAVRQRLYEMAKRDPFFRVERDLDSTFITIFRRDFLPASAYEDATLDDLERKIHERWQRVVQQDLPRLTEVIREQAWLWPDESEQQGDSKRP